jgi:hypothetical protein
MNTPKERNDMTEHQDTTYGYWLVHKLQNEPFFGLTSRSNEKHTSRGSQTVREVLTAIL